MDTNDELFQLLLSVDRDKIPDLVSGMTPAEIQSLVTQTGGRTINMPPNPAAQAAELDPLFRSRAHLDYLSERLAVALHDVENGQNRMIRVSMPPRSGKSTLTSMYLPVWLLRAHPDWKIGMISHEADFATSWGRKVRKVIDDHPELGVGLSPHVTAASEWETTEGGGILARSVGGSITGRGFTVLLLDDVVKGFVDAHSATVRDTVWNWWKSDAFTRLEPPYLVIAIGTRWHEDDFLGRLLSPEHEGNPEEWEHIEFPALAEKDDVLGREPGEPLISPLLDETPEQARERWSSIEVSVGSYTWSALYQQRPSPAEGAIFNESWWRYWTTDRSRVTDDGLVVYFNPEEATGATWLDSWDMAFKGLDSSDYVVGQRWCRSGANRYLIAQTRERMTFTATLKKMKDWAKLSGSPVPYSNMVHLRLVEDKANGTAIIDVLKDEISGLKPVNPTNSKEARARAVTPEIESRNVFLPHPDDPGNSWVRGLVAEARDFPNGANDDQVDGLTQALSELRDPGIGTITVPGRRKKQPVRINRAAAALTLRKR